MGNKKYINIFRRGFQFILLFEFIYWFLVAHNLVDSIFPSIIHSIILFLIIFLWLIQDSLFIKHKKGGILN